MAPPADVLIVGGGVAGLRAALEAAKTRRVTLINKVRRNTSSSAYAQGGIAVALGRREDRDAHVADTLRTGHGLCRPEAVRVLVDQGPRRVRELIRWGVRFDRHGREFALAHEGAHTQQRILRARGDGIGAELTTVLGRLVERHPRIHVAYGMFAADLWMENGRCVGLWILTRGRLVGVPSAAVVLATGGVGQAFWRTTNPSVATGDGLAMALRAGAVLEDIEFVQFHPTALATSGAPSFLLSEAMRGEGAVLRNDRGDAFMARYDPRKDLAPRDVVAQAIWHEMALAQSDHVWLDITGRPRAWLRDRFPSIARTCARYGLDLSVDRIPVAPAAHFMIGGIKTDVWGQTSVPGLYAVGEAACTGVHGANRLASNSLLEGLVFGARTGRAAARARRPALGDRASIESPPIALVDRDQLDAIRARLRHAMWNGVGIIRSGASLGRTLASLRRDAWLATTTFRSPGGWEAKNLHLMASLIAHAALLRRGTLGTHVRSDFPSKGRAWRRHLTVTLTDGETRWRWE